MLSTPSSATGPHASELQALSSAPFSIASRASERGAIFLLHLTSGHETAVSSTAIPQAFERGAPPSTYPGALQNPSATPADTLSRSTSFMISTPAP